MGAWIEIVVICLERANRDSRTPRWVRGLKYYTGNDGDSDERSHPTMGAWIEIR